MFLAVLRYPYAKIVRLLGAVLLFAIPLVNVITGIMGLGYLLTVLEASSKQRELLPEFGHHLFRKGFAVLIVALIYAIPAIILELVAQGRGGLHTVAVILLIIEAIILPSALLRLALTHSFRSAFQLGQIIRGVFSKRGLTAWAFSLGALAIYAAGTYVLTAFTAITVVGPVVVLAFAVTAWLVTVMHAFGISQAGAP